MFHIFFHFKSYHMSLHGWLNNWLPASLSKRPSQIAIACQTSRSKRTYYYYYHYKSTDLSDTVQKHAAGALYKMYYQ